MSSQHSGVFDRWCEGAWCDLSVEIVHEIGLGRRSTERTVMRGGGFEFLALSCLWPPTPHPTANCT